MTPPVVGHFRHAEDRDFARITYDHAPGVPNGRMLTVFLDTVRFIDWEVGLPITPPSKRRPLP